MPVCHHGDRQNDRHIEGSVAVLPSVPSPSSLPSLHNLLCTHMLRFRRAKGLELCSFSGISSPLFLTYVDEITLNL